MNMKLNAHVKVLEQLHMYATYRGETERAAALEAAIDALKRQRPPAVDDFVATFRCENNGVVGTTTAKIHSVSRHDDGVIEVVIDHWPQQTVEGEEIMVNTPYDVFILPLRPSGLDGNNPRFVVHVPDLERAQS